MKNKIDIEKIHFKSKLAGDAAPNFGTIYEIKEFFEYLEQIGYVKFVRTVEQKPPHRNFYTYYVNEDFIYTSPWIMDSTELVRHEVGKDGSILLDVNYFCMGYRSMKQDGK